MSKELNGITVDGKSIEEYLVEHDDDEKKKEALDDFHQTGKDKKGILYHGSQTKCKSARGSSRITTVFTRAQINREYWRDNMARSNTKLQKVLALLLIGEWMTTKDMARKIMEGDPSLLEGRLNVPSRMVAIRKSPVGSFLKRENIGAGKKPVYRWKLIEAALELTLDELYTIYNQKRKKAQLKALIEKRPWLDNYLKHIISPVEEEVDEVEEVVVEKKRIKIEKEPATEDIDLPEQPSKLQQHVADIIKQGLKNAFGVNVKVTGEVKILFGIIGKK